MDSTYPKRFATYLHPPHSSIDTLELFPDPDRPPARHCCNCKCKDKIDEDKTEDSVQDVDKPKTFLSHWQDFSGDTSMHGIKYMFHGPMVARVLFTVLMLVFFGKLMLQLKESVDQYSSRPTSTKIQLADVTGPPSIQFPTISVCSHNPVTKSYLNKYPGLEDIWRLITYSNDDLSAINWTKKPYKLYKNFTFAQILTDGGPSTRNVLQCEHFVNLCYENPALGPEYMERELSISGNCFRINPKGKLFGKGGDYGKLSLKFFADVNEYVEASEDMAQFGYAVAFHDHEQYSGALPTAFWMSPGTIYKVDLSLTTESRLKPPVGTCNDTVKYNTYGRHEENSCLAMCRDDAILKECGCIQIPPPLPQNRPDVVYRPCTLQEWATCGLPAYLKWFKNYVDVNRKDIICHCYPACKERFYKASISSSGLSKLYAAKRVSRLPTGYGSAQDVFDNLMVLDILFTNTQETEINEIATYGWMNFLGDVGGVLGLFLGASAFTLVEFFVFGFVMCWTYCRKVIRR